MLNRLGDLVGVAHCKERERGTVEQLLMTPRPRAKSWLPKFCLCSCFFACWFFSPRRFCGLFSTFHSAATFFLVLSGGALCVLCGIGVGTFIATYTKSAQQAQLMRVLRESTALVFVGSRRR